MKKLWDVWDLGKKIGQGSFGEVYEAQKKELGKTFYSAIKHISLPKEQDEIEEVIREGYAATSKDLLEYYKDTIDDLVKEIEIMYELRANKNIVDYQDHLIVEKMGNEIGFDIYIRMELLKSLDVYLKEKEITESEILKLGIDITNALIVCNKHSLLHRDIKPANIFVDENGTYKLGDFGVARKLEKTTYGMSKKGTYNYMSPEIYKGRKADISSDIYSLGIVMYRLLNNNRAPFIDKNVKLLKASDNETALMRRMNGEEIPDLESVNEDLMRVIKKACSFNLKSRYRNPVEMKADLEKIQKGLKLEFSSEELDKTVSIYDDLDKTVSIYDDDLLDKTVSIYSNELASGNQDYTSDDELRDKIRKIIAEESGMIDTTKQNKYVSIKSYSEKRSIPMILFTMAICVLLFIFNLYVAGHVKLLLEFPYGHVNYSILGDVTGVIILTDFIVCIAFVLSLFSRKMQRIFSYGYLINILILFIMFININVNNYHVSYLYYVYIIFNIILYFINYRWKLIGEIIEVESKHVEKVKNSSKKTEKEYSKPFKSKIQQIITVIILFIMFIVILIYNSVPLKSQSNDINSNEKQIQIVNDYINIREEADSDSDRLGLVYKDEIYTVLGEEEALRNGEDVIWYNIKTSTGINGYIVSYDDTWTKVISEGK